MKVVGGLLFRRVGSCDRVEESAVAPPVDPFQGCVSDLVESWPWSPATDQLGLVEADHGFGEGVVIRIS